MINLCELIIEIPVQHKIYYSNRSAQSKILYTYILKFDTNFEGHQLSSYNMCNVNVLYIYQISKYKLNGLIFKGE